MAAIAGTANLAGLVELSDEAQRARPVKHARQKWRGARKCQISQIETDRPQTRCGRFFVSYTFWEM